LGRGYTQHNKYFKLDNICKNKPSIFEIEFIEGDIFFAYNVSILDDIILEESLYEILSNDEDKMLFERITKKESLVVADEYKSTPKNQLLIKLYETKLLKNNELFLTKAYMDSIEFDKVQLAFDWFDSRLFIVYPETKLDTGGFNAAAASPAFEFTQKMISNLDKGITSLGFEEYKMEDFLGEDDKEMQDMIRKELRERPFVNINDSDGKKYTVVKKEGDIFVCQMITKHKTSSNSAVTFEIEEESDGTQRLLDLLPTIHFAIMNGRVFIIDEINRSVHPTLTKELIKLFMDTKETKGQLIFSTHEAQLLDLNIFRQDEIWFAEKNKSEATELYPLSDFKVRPDLVLKKGYLNGRFGAISFLEKLKELNWEEASDNG